MMCRLLVWLLRDHNRETFRKQVAGKYQTHIESTNKYMDCVMSCLVWLK